jgi:hypothetical protein
VAAIVALTGVFRAPGVAAVEVCPTTASSTLSGVPAIAKLTCDHGTSVKLVCRYQLLAALCNSPSPLGVLSATQQTRAAWNHPQDFATGPLVARAAVGRDGVTRCRVGGGPVTTTETCTATTRYVDYTE